MTTYIYAPSHQRAVGVAKSLGLGYDQWKFISGPDDIRTNEFRLILNTPLTMGFDYRISVAKASGGKVIVEEYLT